MVLDVVEVDMVVEVKTVDDEDVARRLESAEERLGVPHDAIAVTVTSAVTREHKRTFNPLEIVTGRFMEMYPFRCLFDLRKPLLHLVYHPRFSRSNSATRRLPVNCFQIFVLPV